MIHFSELKTKRQTLLLERLERRCMLAAHFDCLHTDPVEVIGDQNGQRSRPGEVRGGDRVRTDSAHSNRHVDHIGPRPGHGGQTSPRPLRTSARPLHPVATPESEAPIPTAPVPVDRGPAESVPAVRESTVPSMSVTLIVPLGRANAVPDISPPRSIASSIVSDSQDDSGAAAATGATLSTSVETESSSAVDAESQSTVQSQELVSFRRGDVHLDEEPASVDQITTNTKIDDRVEPEVNEHLQSLDLWLAEFSRTTDRFGELDSTLDDLALAEHLRSINRSATSSRTEADRIKRFPKVELESGRNGESVDDMIWISPKIQNPTSFQINTYQTTDGSQTLQTTGIGWYQSFEFVDQDQIDSIVEDLSPVMIVAASTSDLAIDGGSSPSSERVSIPVQRSVSYAVVAAGVISWQVLQRRKRHTV